MKIGAGSSMHGEINTREVTRPTGIPYTAVSVALHRTLLCCMYKIQLHHILLSSDFVKLRAFVVLAFQEMSEDDGRLFNVFYPHKAQISIQGSVNSHNCRIWATENARTFVQTLLHVVKFKVWCGFTASALIGLFFFEKMLDSSFETVSVACETYTIMLQNRIILSLADKYLLESTTFIQD